MQFGPTGFSCRLRDVKTHNSLFCAAGGEVWRLRRCRTIRVLHAAIERSEPVRHCSKPDSSCRRNRDEPIELAIVAMVRGIARQPLKKLALGENELLKFFHRWRHEATQAGCEIDRIVVAYEAGRGGFWLAGALRMRVVWLKEPALLFGCIATGLQ